MRPGPDFLCPRRLENCQQRFELLAAVRTLIQMGPDEWHPGGAVLTMAHRLGELVQELVDLFTIELDLLSGLELATNLRRPGRRQPVGGATGKAEPVPKAIE